MNPNVFNLEQNYPNPFNPSTTIHYTVADANNASHVKVSLFVYDILGNGVATLVNEYRPAGSYEVEFNAGNLVSGIYYYTLRVGELSETRKMILLK